MKYFFFIADPHPGNVFVRPHPNKSKKHYQIVLIDHGLYVEESVVFRHQYSLISKVLVQYAATTSSLIFHSTYCTKI